MPNIGPLQLPEFPLLLAPMEDVSDPPFRALCKKHGADLMFTEFISSEGLIRKAAKGLKGDILLSKKDTKGAQAAYQQAWAALVKRQEPRQTIKFKLESLGVEVKDIDVPSPVKTAQ